MDTELIDPPKPYNIRTPEQLKQELSVDVDNWRSCKFWSKNNAIKLLCGVDPAKLDPRSNVHLFYLNSLNIHSFEREMGFLAVHGFLHINGYDHYTPEEEAEMFGLQEEILTAYGLTRQ